MHDTDLIWYGVGHAITWVLSIFIHIGVHSRFSAPDFILRQGGYFPTNMPKMGIESFITAETEWSILFWSQLCLLLVLQILNVVL